MVTLDREVKPMKAYNQLAEEDKQKIIKAYWEGISFKLIPTQCDVSQRAVSRVLKEEGINTLLKNRYRLDSNFFETIDTEKKAYWLGFMYADGYVGDEKHNNIVIGLSEIDLKHLEKFKEDISFTGNIRLAGKGGFINSKPEAVINFSDRKMASDLRTLGLYPNKSMTMKSLPIIPKELMRHFIRGYFDGDGAVYYSQSTSYHKGKKYSYNRIQIQIISTYHFLIDMNSKMPFKSDFKDSHTPEMKYLRFYAKQDMKDIYDFFYKDATVYLQRKYDKFTTLLSPFKE